MPALASDRPEAVTAPAEVATAPPTTDHVRAAIAAPWAVAPGLTATGLALVALSIPFALAMWLDPRIIGGAPAWLKPAKFALSTGLYALTLAWVFTLLPAWERTRRIVGAITVAAMVIEVGLIALQAGRGTTSHFNGRTLFDLLVFNLMGIVIVAQTVASVAVAVALWRQPMADAALGWALRLGLALTIAGASTGGLMVVPTAAQIAELQATRHLTVSGAHTVGAPDGGPGLPVTGWSTQHGDLRVPHFVGLHAWQALPLFVLVGLRRVEPRWRLSLTVAAAGAYALLFVALLVQALRGLPVLPLG